MARVTRVVGWLLFAVYFLVPFYAAIYFSLVAPNGKFSFSPYTTLFGSPGFLTALRTSLLLGLLAVAIVLALLLPAMIAVQLALPRLRPVIEILCTLPLVIPPIAFVSGIVSLERNAGNPGQPLFPFLDAIQNQDFPLILALSYVVLALPFVYRSLDAGLRTLPLRTLVDASRGLGASWPTVVLRVVVPNLRTAVLNAALLTLALALGEYTVSQLLGFGPFSVWIVNYGGPHAQQGVASSILSLLVTWIALLAASFIGGRTHRRTHAKGTS